MDGSKTVMGILKEFGIKSKIKIRLTKTGCVDSSINIPIGQVVEGFFVNEVKIGESFNLTEATVIEGGSNSLRNLKGVKYSYWCTSVVKKIISDDTFQTKNSIYKVEKI